MPMQSTDAFFGFWVPKMTPKTCYVFVWGWMARNIRRCVLCAWLGGRGKLKFGTCGLCDWAGFEELFGWSLCCDQDGGDGATHLQLL